MTEQIITKRDEVRGLLRKLFRNDQADLDFGIYRIMNFKKKEIENFIDHDLIEFAESEFREFTKVKTADLENELTEEREKITALLGSGVFNSEGYSVKHQDTKIVQDYEKKMKTLSQAAVTEEQVNDVFSHIYEFFSRYYEDGDFIPKTRYGWRDKYYVPYNGEEVMLHWATKNMYYVKTGEYFNKYSFKAGRFLVTFRLNEAEVETGNIKGEKKYFILSEEESVHFDNENSFLEIRFNYRQLSNAENERYGTKNIQSTLVTQAIENIRLILESSSIIGLLRSRSGEERSLIEKHLNAYVERNTKDFFIHKNLKGFLNRELDFYLKNEVLNLNDLETTREGNTKYLSGKLRAIRNISEKIIEFLNQIESYQKMLFEKKKFVLATEYCVTLDYVPDEFYDEILKNGNQIVEWKDLFGAGEEKQVTLGASGRGITREYLMSHPHLIIDTKFFDTKFKERLLSKLKKPDGTLVQDLDAEIGGLLIQSENWQALNLLQKKYHDQVKCTYIDPPYNTGSDEFLYKDAYMHSSWLTMLYERMILAKKLLNRSAIFSCSIDDNEMYRLGLLFEDLFGEKQRAACAPWLSEPSGGKEKTGLRTGHEYLLIYHNGDINEISQDEISVGELDRRDKWGPYRKGRELRKWGGTSLKKDRPNQHYPLTAPDGIQVLPIRNDGQEGHWRWGIENPKIIKALSDPEFFHWEKTPFDNGVTYQGVRERWTPFEKIRSEKKTVGWSTWLGSVGINADATRTLKELFGEKNFSTPKPVQLVKWFINLHDDENGIALDFFAGSGVVAHAILNLNEEDGSTRKYILIEMADCFHSVMIPRIKKVVYAAEWKEGRPISGSTGQSHIFKYQTLEQYEDALNNIEFISSDNVIQKKLINFPDYFISYILDYETRESSTRLSTEKFKTPFNYLIRTLTDGEEREKPVDLVETFNYLLGLHVRKIRTFNDGDSTYRCIIGERDHEQVTVIWRDTTNLNLEKDKEFIENMILKDTKPDTIFVNGDSYVKNAKSIEPEFRRLMGA